MKMNAVSMKFVIFIIIATWLTSCTPTHLKKADEAVSNGSYDEAITLCRQAIAADSSDIDAYLLLSEAYRKTDHLREAMATMEAAKAQKLQDSRLNNEYGQIYYALGNAAVKEGRDRVALNWYNLAMEFNPSNTIFIKTAADLNFNLHRMNDAKSQYEALLKSKYDSSAINPKLRSIELQVTASQKRLKMTVSAYENNKLKTAQKHISEAVNLQSDDSDILYYQYLIKGRLLYEEHKHVYKKGALGGLWDAIVAFGTAAEYRKTAAEPHYRMGYAYEKKDKDEYMNAINAFQQALEIEPRGPFAAECRKKIKTLQAQKSKMDKFWGRSK